jgi:surface polysaccharide O-acyltransferase-like enzyme
MKKHFSLLDSAQFVAALLVVLVHCGRLADNELSHFLLKSILCRWAVPFFLILNGYFFRKKAYSVKEWGMRQLKTYFIWTIIYLPYGIYYLQQTSLSVFFYPIALVFAFLTIGTCYHLWYFPALISGMWLVDKTKKFGYPLQFCFAGMLYIIGASETYSSYLSEPLLTVYLMYQRIFVTTRNGIFYGFLFLLCGVSLADYQNAGIFQNHLWKKISLVLCLLLMEGKIIFANQGDDKNFLLMMVPVALFVTALLIKNNRPSANRNTLLRQASRTIFFVHPIVLEVIKIGTSLQGLSLFTWTVLGVGFLFAGRIILTQMIDTRCQMEYGNW